MLKIKSDSIIVKSSAKKCVEYLCDLNNYQFLLPKDKINNWQSSKDFCIFSIQKAYTLDIVKESSNNDQILLKSGVKSQFKFCIKIKIQEKSANSCTTQIICEANVNPLLKVMVGKPLNELFNHMANNIEKAISVD